MLSPLARLHELLARLYGKRIINVNVNILAAGAMAIGVLYAVMFWIDRLKIGAHIADQLKVDVKWVVLVLTFVIDLVADLAIYYVLHWYANHVPSRFGGGGKLLNPEYSDLTFMQDATKIQLERMILSPILYTLALGLQWILMHNGMKPHAAGAIGFAIGITTTRTLHTIWMLWEQKHRRAKMLRQNAGAPVSASDP